MVNNQLSLFDTSTEVIGSYYKAGDWVQLKRNPKTAECVKRGDVVKIEAVHAGNGNVKFWNEDTQRYDFLYPEEIKLTVEPVARKVEVKQEVKPIVESVVGEAQELDNVESVVGEISRLTVESVVGEAQGLDNVESVVGETQALDNVESVVGEAQGLDNVESVVGEAQALNNVESVVGEIRNPKNYWNYDKEYTANGWLESHYKIRVNGKQRSIKCPEIGSTGPYNSYRWMDGKRQRARYCPNSKCPAVKKALAIGQPISEILKIISNQ